MWQCYGRYLDQFGDQHIEDIVDIKTVKEIFFPDGLETDNASLTVTIYFNTFRYLFLLLDIAHLSTTIHNFVINVAPYSVSLDLFFYDKDTRLDFFEYDLPSRINNVFVLFMILI